MKKYISIILTIAMVICMFNTVTFASAGKIRESVNKIVSAVAYFGYAIAFGMLIFIGIKYAMSPANEKANVKQGSINYLIGAIVIACASSIASIIIGIAGSSTASGIINAAGGITSSIGSTASDIVNGGYNNNNNNTPQINNPNFTPGSNYGGGSDPKYDSNQGTRPPTTSGAMGSAPDVTLPNGTGYNR